MNELISGFDVMVHPAIYLEVFGLKIAEALSMEKPVISTRCGGVEEQITDAFYGFLVEPHDTDALRQAIQRVVDRSADISEIFQVQRLSLKSTTEHAHELLDFYDAMLKTIE